MGILLLTFNVPLLVLLQALAAMVTDENLAEGRLYPPLANIREVSTQIAIKIAEYAYTNKMAAHYPEPDNKDDFIRSQLYSTDYDSFVPDMYDWPEVKGQL